MLLLKTRCRATACALGAVLLSCPPAVARDYFVAPDGRDDNPGTRALSFRTIQRAADVMQPGDTCIIRAGTYRETVTPPISGQDGAPIVFRAHEGEQVTVSGTDPLTGWTRHEGAVYTAPMDWDLGKNNHLFLDGRMVNEARWPRKTSDDIMDPEGAPIESADEGGIVAPDLPDGDWTGAVVWALAGSKWTSWTATVTGYDAEQKKLLFPLSDGLRRFHDPARGGEFYLVGKLGLLDGPNEWYCDGEAGLAYLWAPEDADPNAHEVEAKTRLLAFDLRDRAHIHVIGVNVHAATLDLRAARHCLVQGIRATYVSHTRGGDTGYGLNEPTGITISGTGNVLRDSEIAYSVGDGVLLEGSGNAVINCHVHHIDYIGAYGTPVKLRGREQMMSHNTVHDAGRDCIQIGGQAHLVQFNRVYNAGRIAQDLGFLYTVSNDGGGTEIRYNWFHDNLSRHVRCGIYLDNFTSNYLVHHNVVWNTRGSEIRLNKPSQYNQVYNNTLLGDLGNWGRWPADTMYGVRVWNNLLTGRIAPHPELSLAGNVEGVSADALTPETFTYGDLPGQQAGVHVPGITDGFTGRAPNAGAYQAGGPGWTAGHDFANPPEPEYGLTRTPYCNRIVNGSFDWEPRGDVIHGWEKTHAGTARIVWGASGITEHQDARDSFIGRAVRLEGQGEDGIRQTVTDLEPGTRYVLAGWAKVKDAPEVLLGVIDHGGQEAVHAVSATIWEHMTVKFTTGPDATSATVYVLKRGAGQALADELGVIRADDR